MAIVRTPSWYPTAVQSIQATISPAFRYTFVVAYEDVSDRVRAREREQGEREEVEVGEWKLGVSNKG